MSSPLPHTAFEDPALDAALDRAAESVRTARHCVALTGAGLSVESGIPPFRGPGGLWTRHGEPPLDGYQRFLRDPAQAWRERLAPQAPWLRALGAALAAAQPNAGHRALVELEALGGCAALITQNIDDLHRKAGQQNLLEIHGNHFLLRCIGCMQRFEPAAIAVDPEHLPPRCPHCGGLVKGDTVHFGEPIPPAVLRACQREVERADCMLLVGTSASVYPAAEFPFEVLRRGGCVIEINPEPSDFSDAATLCLRGAAGDVLPRLVARLAANAEARA